ncbi:unnamed protein product [Malus baccata var. baccata]
MNRRSNQPLLQMHQKIQSQLLHHLYLLLLLLRSAQSFPTCLHLVAQHRRDQRQASNGGIRCSSSSGAIQGPRCVCSDIQRFRDPIVPRHQHFAVGGVLGFSIQRGECGVQIRGTHDFRC